jgi:hypothetical protein
MLQENLKQMQEQFSNSLQSIVEKMNLLEVRLSENDSKISNLGRRHKTDDDSKRKSESEN